MNISWIDDESIVRHCKPSGSVGSGWCFNETRSTTCSQMLHERMKTTGFARLGSSFTWHGAEGPHVCAQQPTNHTTPSHTPHWAPKHSCSLFNFTWDLVSELVQKTTGNAQSKSSFCSTLQAACSKPLSLRFLAETNLGNTIDYGRCKAKAKWNRFLKHLQKAYKAVLEQIRLAVSSWTNPLGCVLRSRSHRQK